MRRVPLWLNASSAPRLWEGVLLVTVCWRVRWWWVAQISHTGLEPRCWKRRRGKMEGMPQKHNTAWHVWNGLFAAWLKHSCQKERRSAESHPLHRQVFSLCNRAVHTKHVYVLPVTRAMPHSIPRPPVRTFYSSWNVSSPILRFVSI